MLWRKFVGTLVKAWEPRFSEGAVPHRLRGDRPSSSGIAPLRDAISGVGDIHPRPRSTPAGCSPTRHRANAIFVLATPFFASSCANRTVGCMSSRERPVGRITMSETRGDAQLMFAVEFGGASSIMRSIGSAACRACSIVPKRSTAITGSIADCRRRPCQLKLVPWETSRSAIFVRQPAFANSLATMRASVDFPTPPFVIRWIGLRYQCAYVLSFMRFVACGGNSASGIWLMGL